MKHKFIPLFAFAAGTMLMGTAVSAATTEDSVVVKKELHLDSKSQPAEHVGVIKINERSLATDLIGKVVYNKADERIAKVSDVILNREGAPIMVILADGDFTGLGKTVAFEFSVLSEINEDGNVIADISEENIDQAAAFSYDREDYSDTVKVIPSNGFSVAELLEGNIIDQAGEVIASVEDVSLSGNGEGDQIIVSFNQTLGFGGDEVALNYNDLKVVRHEEDLNFQMTAEQAATFKTYKDVVKD